MDDRQHMRASDSDRQEVVDAAGRRAGRGPSEDGRARGADGAGLLGGKYGDLAELSADLSEAGQVTRPKVAPPAAAPRAVPAPQRAVADLPAALKVLWTIWPAAVAIN